MSKFNPNFRMYLKEFCTLDKEKRPSPKKYEKIDTFEILNLKLKPYIIAATFEHISITNGIHSNKNNSK